MCVGIHTIACAYICIYVSGKIHLKRILYVGISISPQLIHEKAIFAANIYQYNLLHLKCT